MATRPLAVLIDPGVPAALSEMLQDYPMPMLPMGTRPMLAHWLERLLAAGINDVLLLLEHMPEKTRDWLEHHTPAGMTTTCANIRSGQNFKTQSAHLTGALDRPMVVADLASFPAESVVEDLAEALHRTPLVSIQGAERWATKLSEHLSQSLHVLPAEHLANVRLPRDIWQINMDILADKLHDPAPFGFEAERHCYVASNCKIANDVRYHAPLAIGESCIFSARVHLGPNVVAAEKCVFDVGCFVQDCVVFGRTFIGSNIVLRKAVVSGSMVYLVDEDRVGHIDDVAMLAKRDNNDVAIGLVQRAMAVITLLFLLLPIVALAIYRSLKNLDWFKEEDIYLESGRDLNGFRAFRRLRVKTLLVRHRAWRKTLWLWMVVRGEMPLVGSCPRRSQDFEYPTWVTDAEEFAPGVMTLADITVAHEATCEEIVIADAYQLAKGEVGSHLGMWWRWMLALFTFKN